MVSAELSEGDVLIAYHSRGHAGKESRNGLIVCNGLSAVEYQFLYSVKQLCPGVEVDFNAGKGNFNMILKGDISEYDFQIYRVLSQSFLIGVAMLKNRHPEEINVKIIGDGFKNLKNNF